MNKRKLIIAITVFLSAIILFFIVLKKNSTENIEILETEGDYSGYQLILTAKYGGTGVDGHDLGHGVKKKIFNISQNDVFYEPSFGGMWILNLDMEEYKNPFGPYTMCEILELEENTTKVKIKNEDKIYVVEYNQEIDISSNTITCDGINWSYSMKIIKD